ncbi:hypothetical protein ACFU53_26175 [Streptomyces sp. NPDC057474]|uniref:hypothetical protein n=1 Tax=Streptomyces sp. NPDC057474 TaxID=3346144 RepID=UPI003699E0A3
MAGWLTPSRVVHRAVARRENFRLRLRTPAVRGSHLATHWDWHLTRSIALGDNRWSRWLGLRHC